MEMTKEEFLLGIKTAGWEFKSRRQSFEKWLHDTYHHELWIYENGFTIMDLGYTGKKHKYSSSNLGLLLLILGIYNKMEPA